MPLSPSLHYDINLPESVNDIIKYDFWVLDHVSVDLIRLITEPVKFTSACSIFVRKGRFRAEIDLVEYNFEAPCLVNIGSGHILQYPTVSDDFDAIFLVTSKKITENLFVLVNDSWLYSVARTNPVVGVPPLVVPYLERLYQDIGALFVQKDNPFRERALILRLASFMFGVGWKCYEHLREDPELFYGRLSERFLRLLRENFKQERLLDFYAKQLQVTAKHLSRTVKEQTGSSPVDWISRYVILEAKVLLKSTELHVQQIADELNFASQSIFGKYFKKHTGLTPREFRNS